jgi:dTDP-4-dehydrorhamnose 3,5-epimerase
MAWIGAELTALNHRALYVPEGCAHGFLTLADDTEVTYFVSAFHSPAFERGVRYDDPRFQIRWPMEIRVISDKDQRWPDYAPGLQAASVMGSDAVEPRNGGPASNRPVVAGEKRT